MTAITLKRRDFLKLGLAGLVSTAVSAKFFKKNSKSGEAESPHRWAMVIDLNKCVGCKQCVSACQASNDIAPDMAWNRILDLGEINGKETFLPVQVICRRYASAGKMKYSASRSYG